MNGERLLQERLSRKWEQRDAAAKLKVSQPYLSLIESGKRRVPSVLARRAAKVFKLPATALPIESLPEKSSSPAKAENLLAMQLAAFGYPRFAHLRKSKKVNPATVLINALLADDLDSRIVEALPWLVLNFSEMNWSYVVEKAKLGDAQNRLGFVLSLADKLSTKAKDESKKALFKTLLRALERSRLAQNDSFRRSSLTETEKAWLRRNRPKEARHWRVLSNLSANHLVY